MICNKLITAAVAALAVAVAPSSSAHADEPGADAPVRVGIGARGGFAGGSVAAAIASRHLDAELTATESLDHMPDGSTWRMIGVAAAVLPVIARRGPVALEAGLRLSVGWNHLDVPGTSVGESSGRELVVSAPLRIEVDVARWLSIQAEGAIDLVATQPALNLVGPRVWPGGQYLGGFTVWF